MDQVEPVAFDPAIKGLWLIPIYKQSHRELPARKRLVNGWHPCIRRHLIFEFWDCAYVVHHLDPNDAKTLPT